MCKSVKFLQIILRQQKNPDNKIWSINWSERYKGFYEDFVCLRHRIAHMIITLAVRAVIEQPLPCFW